MTFVPARTNTRKKAATAVVALALLATATFIGVRAAGSDKEKGNGNWYDGPTLMSKAGEPILSSRAPAGELRLDAGVIRITPADYEVGFDADTVADNAKLELRRNPALKVRPPGPQFASDDAPAITTTTRPDEAFYREALGWADLGWYKTYKSKDGPVPSELAYRITHLLMPDRAYGNVIPAGSEAFYRHANSPRASELFGVDQYQANADAWIASLPQSAMAVVFGQFRRLTGNACQTLSGKVALPSPCAYVKVIVVGLDDRVLWEYAKVPAVESREGWLIGDAPMCRDMKLKGQSC